MTLNLLYAILTGIIPPIIWLAFWLREDSNPEPRGLIFSLFFSGALGVFVALFGEKFVASMGYTQNIQYIIWAAIEEVIKFIILITVALNAKTNDEPIDSMMYCITIALGFAAIENTLFVMGPFSQGNVITGLITGNMRAIGATLVHTVSTVCAGFTYGYFYYSNRFTKSIALVIGLVAGVAIHAAFNISVIGGDSTNTLKAFGWIWGAVVVMIVLFEEIKLVRPEEI